MPNMKLELVICVNLFGFVFFVYSVPFTVWLLTLITWRGPNINEGWAMNRTPMADRSRDAKWARLSFSFRATRAKTVTRTVLRWSKAVASEGLMSLRAKWRQIMAIVPNVPLMTRNLLEPLGPRKQTSVWQMANDIEMAWIRYLTKAWSLPEVSWHFLTNTFAQQSKMAESMP